MRNIGEWPPRGALRGVLQSDGDPAYVKTPAAVAVVAIMGVLAEMDDPPRVRFLTRPGGLHGALESGAARRARAELDADTYEVRISRSLVTDTMVVTPEDVTSLRASPGADGGVASDGAEGTPFAESVYAAHVREWELADPVPAPDSATVSG